MIEKKRKNMAGMNKEMAEKYKLTKINVEKGLKKIP